MALFSALSQVPVLWPFDDAWATVGPSHGAVLGTQRHGPLTERRYVHEAIQVLWTLQESQKLNQDTARALAQSVMATLGDHPDIEAVSPWLTIIQAQQLALDGDLSSARALLSSFQLEAIDQRSPVSLACEVMGWYRLALLIECPVSAEMIQGCAHPDARGVHRYQRALAPANTALRALTHHQKPLPHSMKAHVARISAVARADDPLTWHQKDRTQLLHDTVRAPSALHRAHAMLALGLSCRAQGQDVRSRACFTQAWELAMALHWQQGAWVSGIELLSLPAAQADGPPPPGLATALRAMLPTGQAGASQGGLDHAEANTEASGGRPSRLESAMAYVRQHLARRISVEQLARHCGVTPRTLGQDFKDKLGISPLEFMTQERMQLAQQLLADGQRSLIEVARMVGYDTALGLSKAYAKTFGGPPRSTVPVKRP